MTETKNKVTDIRVRRTYNQLTEALIKLLAQKSFDDLTVLEICNRANVHRATFYKHFVDKHDFLNCCFKMKLAELELEKTDKDFVFCVSFEHYSSSFTNSLSDAIADFIIEQIRSKASFSEKLGYNLQLMAYYYSGAIVNLVRWWSTSENVCSKRMFIEFAKRKIDDLCNYFASFSDGEQS